MIKNKIFKFKFLFYNFNKFKSYFITSPIYYPNDKPHIGHLYTNCICDVYARWNRLKGNSVLYSTGTDEHGIKIQKSAEKLNVNYYEFVDSLSNKFKTLFDSSEISYSDFIRTSENRHKETVNKVWRELISKNCLRKDVYSGWYSVTDECFISNNFTFENKSHDSSEWYEEENWIFDVEKFKPEIRKWANSNVIYPSEHMKFINDSINEINHISVSRPSCRLKWGIPVPNDPNQTIYVWFDALINYLTVSQNNNGNLWPTDLQVIGKEIVRFHTVLWPAILLALDLELPKKILIHSHWLLNGVKMSKSLGNIIDPYVESEILGGYEQLKYFLLTEDVIGGDRCYDRICAIETINSHLVNTIGNLLSRISGVKINRHQRWGADIDIDEKIFVGNEYNKLISQMNNLCSQFEKHINNFDIHLAIDSVISVLRQTNVFFDSQKPWKLFDDERIKEAVIYVSSESLRMSAILFQCLLPNFADKILNRLLIDPKHRTLAEMHFNQHGQENFRYFHNNGDCTKLLQRIIK